MKLLFLLPGVPDPPHAGAHLRNLGLLRLAGAEHEVHALAFGGASEAARLAALARRAELVPHPRGRGRARRALCMLNSPLPDVAARFWSLAYVERLHQLLASERYDVVQAEGIEMARYLRAVQPRDELGRPWRVYDAHNAEFLLQYRAFTAALARRGVADFVAASYSLVQWRHLARFEREVVQGSRLTLAVSHHDANQLAALGPTGAKTRVVRNGLDVARYPFCHPGPEDEPALLFLGKLDYRPNGEALAWLVKEVLPRLVQREPQARLFVVGHNPPAWLVAAGQRDDRIAVVGAVPDERPYLKRASALVLPLAVGGGSRLKALVAFASGLPVVSTRLGMEGIEAEPGVHYLQVGSPEEWAETLGRLFRDVDWRSRLASHGRALVEGTYDWSAVAPALRAAYAHLADG